MLQLVGIAVLMVFGFVVLLAALTFDAVKADRPRDVASARERRRASERRRQRWEWLTRQSQQASSVARRAAQAVGVGLSALAGTVVHDWWPVLRHQARPLGWPGEEWAIRVIAIVLAPVISVSLIVALG